MYSRILTTSAKAARIAPIRAPTHLRALHGSTSLFYARKTTGQAPDAARDTKEYAMLDQNPHLKHAASAQGGKEGRDAGAGNAACEPELPSKKLKLEREGKTKSTKAGKVNGKKGFHSSAVALSDGKGKESATEDPEHTMDSYLKESDESPPLSEKTYRVDGASEATHRPNEHYSTDPEKDYAAVKADEHAPDAASRKLEGSAGQTPSGARGLGNDKRTLHTSASVHSQDGDGQTKHTADSYFKEVDSNPPPSEKTFHVDSANDATHRPNEQYANPDKEYTSVSKEAPYEPPVEKNGYEKHEQREQTLRYGGTKKDQLKDAPKKEEGPQDQSAGGRKPEGRE